MDFRKKLLVTPGKTFRLKDIDPDFHGGITSPQDAA